MMNGDDDEVDTHEIDIIRIRQWIIMAIKMIEYLMLERYIFDWLRDGFVVFDLA